MKSLFLVLVAVVMSTSSASSEAEGTSEKMTSVDQNYQLVTGDNMTSVSEILPCGDHSSDWELLEAFSNAFSVAMCVGNGCIATVESVEESFSTIILVHKQHQNLRLVKQSEERFGVQMSCKMQLFELD